MSERYCLGFAFDSELKHVCLIRKLRPDWQKGKLNGIGGHLEGAEGGKIGMSREFKEETGVEVEPNRWKPLTMITMLDSVNKIWCYYTVLNIPEFEHVKTQTDEEVVKYHLQALKYHKYIPNLDWLIPLAYHMHTNPNEHIDV